MGNRYPDPQSSPQSSIGYAEYTLPAHRLSGTPTEVLAELDDIILGLTGLRQIISLQGSTRADRPKWRLRLLKSSITAAILLSAFWSVQPAMAQTAQRRGELTQLRPTAAEAEQPAVANALKPAPFASEQEEAAAQSASQGQSNPFEHVQFGVTLEGYTSLHPA